jgi:uncharacterized protein
MSDEADAGRRAMLKTTAAAVLGSYALVAGLTRLGFRSLLYPAPSRGLEAAPPNGELRAYATPDGQRVQVAYYDAPGPRLLVFFHGNGESIADSVGLATEMQQRGLRFAAVEYRGYGSSPSSGPSEAGLYADAEGALMGLLADGQPSDSLVLWGSSLGTGVAVEMSLRGFGRRLILQAPYTSIPAVAGRIAPIFPTRWLITDRFDNQAKAAQIGVPTLVIHGEQDRIVPFDMGQTIAQTIEGAELLQVADAGHNDLFVRARDRVLGAIARHASAT